MPKVAERTLQKSEQAIKRKRQGSEMAKRMRLLRKAKIEAVQQAVEAAGMAGEKDSRIAGRINSKLIDAARERTGIVSDTELLEFALANVALEDNFAASFRKTQGTVDPALKLDL